MAKLSDHSSDDSPAESSEQEQLPVNEEEDEEELEAVARTVATDDDDFADEQDDVQDNEVYFTLFITLSSNSIDLSLFRLISLLINRLGFRCSFQNQVSF